MKSNGPVTAQAPVVLAQVVYNPADNTIGLSFAPFVSNPILAAGDIIKACADIIQQTELQKEQKEPPKPQILVPSMVLR